MKFTFQSVFKKLPKILNMPVCEEYSISFDLIGQHQNKRFYITEIVWLLRFADVILLGCREVMTGNTSVSTGSLLPGFRKWKSEQERE